MAAGLAGWCLMTDRTEAEHLAATLAADRLGRDDEGRSLSFGAYLT